MREHRVRCPCTFVPSVEVKAASEIVIQRRKPKDLGRAPAGAVYNRGSSTYFAEILRYAQDDVLTQGDATSA